ncbi:MAG TPA: PIN domain-containing protein [Thermoanaerobaculia bacterium]|nr:PIN domain-containing protein [Thermoanaerobaculia bacterium]
MKERLLFAFDSGPWIHWGEQNESFLPDLTPMMDSLAEGNLVVISSVLALVEVLTGSFRSRNEVRSRRFLNLFEATEGVEVLDVDREIGIAAARFRARYGLRTPDAIHVATGVAAGASAFVTTDRRLSVVREIEVRVLRPTHSRRRS